MENVGCERNSEDTNLHLSDSEANRTYYYHHNHRRFPLGTDICDLYYVALNGAHATYTCNLAVFRGKKSNNMSLPELFLMVCFQAPGTKIQNTL